MSVDELNELKTNIQKLNQEISDIKTKYLNFEIKLSCISKYTNYLDKLISKKDLNTSGDLGATQKQDIIFPPLCQFTRNMSLSGGSKRKSRSTRTKKYKRKKNI